MNFEDRDADAASRRDRTDDESVVMLAEITSKAGARPQVLEALRALAGGARLEEGTEVWLVHIDPLDDQTIWVYERYTNQAALDNHQGAPSMAAAFVALQGLTEGRARIRRLTPVSGDAPT